jgi:transcriptional regulator with XRE-family HTH domain/transposase-like protein
MSAPRVKRDCEHKQARHEHGTQLAYIRDRCRCHDCTAASAKAEDQRNRQIAYGRYDTGRVDAQPVREHIQTLANYGIGMDRTATLAGISKATVMRIIYGSPTLNIKPRARVDKHIAEAIQAIQPELRHLGQKTTVNAAGTRRRIQALVAIGWSQSRIAEQLGMSRPNFSRALHGENVHAETARKVQALYDQLWNRPQTGNDHRTRISANRARNHARTNGWHPPLAWDDETIDDHAAQPNVFEETPLIHGEDRCNEIEWLIQSGCGQAEILKRTGFNSINSLDTFCRRQGRTDITHRIKRLRETERAA